MAKSKPKKPAAKRAAKPTAAAGAAKKYRVLNDGTVLRLADGAHIPPDDANADFRAFAREIEADPSIVADV